MDANGFIAVNSSILSFLSVYPVNEQFPELLDQPNQSGGSNKDRVGYLPTEKEDYAMATHYYFMKDPIDGKPMLVNDCPKGRKIYFRRVDYLPGNNPSPKYGPTPPEFHLIFNNANNKFIDSIEDSSGHDDGTPIVTFTSKPGSTGGKDFQEVYIEFKAGSQPNDGFRYEVEMQGQIMDPRVRPR